MNLIEKVKDLVKQDPKTLVLPEAKDTRTLKAAAQIVSEGFAKKVILLGSEKEIQEKAKSCAASLDGIEIIDHLKSEKKAAYAESYFQLRKGKKVSFQSAIKIVENPLSYGTFMVREGDADSMVAGAINTTANVLRAAIHIIGTAPGIKVVSGSFIMIVPNCDYGENGILAFADSGVIPDPNPRQLADIAISTARTFQLLIGEQPRVAMLSFSTKGSAKHWLADKVIEAAKIVKENNPDIVIDGELQPDAALVPAIGKRKAPDSSVAGKANVLIFPDLNSGNIAYKLVERLAKAKAYGPLIQGLNIPISDLSRGCSVTDIVEISAIILRIAHENK